MNRWQSIVSIGAAFLLLGIGMTGCNGPSPALDPIITWNLDKALDLYNFPSGSILNIKADGSVADATKNPIIAAEWSIIPEAPFTDGGVFLVTAPFSLQNVWQAPNISKTSLPEKVTLRLHTKTLLGGETTSVLNIRVVPRVTSFYAFDYNNIFNNALNPNHFSNVLAGTQTKILDNVLLSSPEIDGNATFEWSANPDVGAFDNTSLRNPVWTSPALQSVKDPTTGAISYPPLAVKLSVRIRTGTGLESVNSMIVNVVHDLANP
ncbi:MAG: hypothetical protein WCJ56_00965 [bacterium]